VKPTSEEAEERAARPITRPRTAGRPAGAGLVFTRLMTSLPHTWPMAPMSRLVGKA